MKLTDQEYILKYKKTGNQKWLGLLYKDYIESVYGVGLKYFKNSTDAEDLVMTVYETISKKLISHEIDNFRSWLYVVAKNLCFEQLRKKTRQLSREKEAFDMYSEQVFHPDNIKDESQLQKLRGCLENLSIEQKQCVEMFYIQNQTYQVVADELNISWNRVRSHIQNGRRNLKICIESN